jgi:hypothetical protein
MTSLLACASHVLVDLPLFGGPVLLVGGAAFVMARFERQRDAEDLDTARAVDQATPLGSIFGRETHGRTRRNR